MAAPVSTPDNPIGRRRAGDSREDHVVVFATCCVQVIH